MKIEDFIKVDKNTFISKDNEYQLHCDSQGFIYPYYWYYPNVKKTEGDGNFWTCMVHTSYDYSFTFEGALAVLNMVLEKTWKHGEGRYLNGLSTEKI
jgi:hypothetical protein